MKHASSCKREAEERGHGCVQEKKDGSYSLDRQEDSLDAIYEV